LRFSSNYESRNNVNVSSLSPRLLDLLASRGQTLAITQLPTMLEASKLRPMLDNNRPTSKVPLGNLLANRA